MRSKDTAIACVWLAGVVSVGLVSCQTSCGCGSSNTSCQFPAVCKHVVIDSTVLDFTKSPFYDQVTYDTASVGFDNICTTFFKIGYGTYLVCRSHIYSNGSSYISKLIVSEVSELPGLFRWQGKTDSTDACSSAVFNDYTLQNLQSDCGDIIVVYRCFTYGEDCVKRFGIEDSVVGYSSSPTISEELVARIRIAAESSGLNLGSFHRLPNRLAKRCVTKVGNVTAINACTVSACDAYEI